MQGEQLATKLAFLRATSAFDGVREVIETHMSWVFLTAGHAFKLKKPVSLPYVDYRTLERRRQSCVNEVRLGRRLAPNVYDEVVPLVTTETGLALGGDGEVVDWVVVMRRLPNDRALPDMLARGAVTGAHADALGDLLAAFYSSAVRTSWDAGEYHAHQRGLVLSAGGELVARGASRAAVEDIVRFELAGLAQAGPVFAARIAAGRIVDAHGDLRPEHVFFEPAPLVIDPLEFDDDLRMLDAASELAFFGLECARLGAAWFSDRVLARYSERTGDGVPDTLMALYRAQHALTRATLALRHTDDAPLRNHPHWRAKAADYLSLSLADRGSP